MLEESDPQIEAMDKEVVKSKKELEKEPAATVTKTKLARLNNLNHYRLGYE